MTIFNVCCIKVYEEEDQLLWCPDVLSECKVKDYLREALSQSTDDSTENSTSENIRDNEQVCALQILSLINIINVKIFCPCESCCYGFNCIFFFDLLSRPCLSFWNVITIPVRHWRDTAVMWRLWKVGCSVHDQLEIFCTCNGINVHLSLLFR